MKALLITLALSLLPASALAQEDVCPEEHTCVPDEDMEKIVQVLKERKCLDSEAPEILLSDIKIVVDQDGRVFYTGKGPDSPFTLEMSWCDYQIEAEGEVNVIAAVKEPPVWGFRLRPKAYMGYSVMAPFFDGNSFADGIDAGIMLDFLHYKWGNVNATLGFRTLGAGVGADITTNFGGYLGWGLAWESLIDPTKQPLHNVVVGFSFAF